MHDPEDNMDEPGKGELSVLETLLTDCPLFSRARVRWAGGTWDAGQILKALHAQTGLQSFAGVRVATLIHDPFLSGMATLSVMTGGSVCLPLNPDWKAQEVREVLQELGIQVVVVDRPDCFQELLEELALTVHLLGIEDGQLTSRSLRGEPREATSAGDDCCLILLSSGSTGKPKAVPLRLQQLTEAATEIIQSMELSDSDACLNFLPMMHIGGFLDQFLVPLRSGGLVAFADPKLPELALQLAVEERVTWLQGAPAMLNNLLRVQGNFELPGLRFLRSVSAPLPSSLLGRLEERFGAPVIEMYGMSETAGVIASNPLPPEPRKLGSVGIVSCIELQVRNSAGADGHPQIGEVWIRGSRVFRGYLGDGGCAQDWDGDWFRTGDLATLDSEGYLFLKGRLGEQINRGGQKFSPVELDDLCSAWPEVSEAAGFAFPHESLGQEVGVALVCESAGLNKQGVQERLGRELAPYKVPRRVIFIEHLPRNQNGKLQRHRLASMGGALAVGAPESGSEVPSPLQARMQGLWQRNLNLDLIGLDDDYFESGGDSLSATILLTTIEQELRAGMEAVDFFENATVRKLVDHIEASQRGPRQEAQATRELDLDPGVGKKIRRIMQTWPGSPVFPDAFGIDGQAPSAPGPEQTNLFWGCNGQVEFGAVLRISAFRVVAYRTLYELQARDKREIDRLCQVYADEIERIQPQGALVFGGFCDGADLMERVAKILSDKGREIRLFIAHDYLPLHNLRSHHAFILSHGWQANPVHHFPQFQKGLVRHHRGAVGVLLWKGGHNDYKSPEFTEQLEPFLVDQLRLSAQPPEATAAPIRPQVQLRFRKRPPRLLKTEREQVIEILVTNMGDRPLAPEDGFTLAARWENHTGKLRVQAPMSCPIQYKLDPGQEWRAELRVICHKRFRLETLKIGFLEQGLDWSWLDYGPPGILTCTLFAF